MAQLVEQSARLNFLSGPSVWSSLETAVDSVWNGKCEKWTSTRRCDKRVVYGLESGCMIWFGFFPTRWPSVTLESLEKPYGDTGKRQEPKGIFTQRQWIAVLLLVCTRQGCSSHPTFTQPRFNLFHVVSSSTPASVNWFCISSKLWVFHCGRSSINIPSPGLRDMNHSGPFEKI